MDKEDELRIKQKLLEYDARKAYYKKRRKNIHLCNFLLKEQIQFSMQKNQFSLSGQNNQNQGLMQMSMGIGTGFLTAYASKSIVFGITGLILGISVCSLIPQYNHKEL